jgi:hypothetical protein
MTETKNLLALFDDIDPAAEAIEKLRSMGIHDGDMNIIAGVQVTEAMLGRPRQWSNVGRLALGGAVAGALIGLFLAFGTPFLYKVPVGGQPFFPGAPGIIVFFEITMLGMLVSTFLGVFLDSYFPSYRPKEYVPEISNGKIAILFYCPADKEDEFITAMTNLGAQSTKPAEAVQL